MKNCKEILLSLLTCAVCGEAVSHDRLPQLSDEEIKEVYNLSKKHDLAHLVGTALETSKAEDKTRYKLFFAEAVKAMYRYEWLKGEKEKILDLLEKNNIPHIPLKGAVIRSLYREPWHRTSCDIDILIPEEQLEEAICAFESDLSYSRGKRSRHDVSLTAPNGVHLELHFDIDEKYVDRSEFWDDAQPVTEKNFQFALSSEMLILTHIAHMAKHFLNGGCGLRPFLDLWLMKEKLQYDSEKLSLMLNNHRLAEFGKAVLGIVAVWFDQKTPTETEIMVQDFIFSGGVYGNLYNNISVTRSEKNIFFYIVQRIFPPYRSLLATYPSLRKHPWLLPLCWVHRWIRLIYEGKLTKVKDEYSINRRLNEDELDHIGELLKRLELKKLSKKRSI